MDTSALQSHNRRYRSELLDNVIPFWEKHSPDQQNGGYFNCLDRDGTIYDRKKHVWMQGRQVWIFSKLYNTVEPKDSWFRLAKNGITFLRKHAVRHDNRVYFCLSEDGKPVYLQRKIFSECFYIMALAEFSRASGEASYMEEARSLFKKVWDWSGDLSKVSRPAYEGAPPLNQLAIPMILLNLIEELDQEDEFDDYVTALIDSILLHVNHDRQLVYEHVLQDGSLHDSPEGRLINPGHAIEAGWFLQHWAQRRKDPQLQQTAIDMVRRSHDFGWDSRQGGLFYFLDADGYPPVQLEWFMKLWWPQCEALYAHLLNYQLTGDEADWQRYTNVFDYTFRHFPDNTYGEWYGYLNRDGTPTNRCKGAPYKGCFHLPRAMWLCFYKTAELIEAESS